jgi:small-conductance mechanosensitive channel
VLLAAAILVAQFVLGGLSAAATDPAVVALVPLSVVPALVLAVYVRRAGVTGGAPLSLLVVTFLLGVLGVLGQLGVRQDFLANTALAALFAFVFYVLWAVLNRLLIDAVRRTGVDRSLIQLLRNVTAVLVGAFAIIAVLNQFEIDVLGAVAALGIVGIAVGFAAQETLSNFISGITLLVERPFRIGDWVEVSGKVGRVAQITLRTTRVVDRNNVLISIPNASIASSDIVNLTAGGPLRVRLDIGIAYKESARQAREVILPVVAAHDKVLGGPGLEPKVLMDALDDSSVNLRILFWIAPHDIATQPGVSAHILEGCKEALDEAGIEIPFPHLQLFVDEAKGLPPVLEPFYRKRAAERPDA